jgi:hypothetical protein
MPELIETPTRITAAAVPAGCWPPAGNAKA